MKSRPIRQQGMTDELTTDTPPNSRTMNLRTSEWLIPFATPLRKP